ncbi:MAG: retropepsin-like aspartic protease [Pseudomonadota bacterium]
MNTRLLFIVVFVAGVSTGWLANSWMDPGGLPFPASLGGDNTAAQHNGQSLPDSATGLLPDSSQTTDTSAAIKANTATPLPRAQTSTSTSVTEHFRQLLSNQRYATAITLYQEQQQQSNQTAALLKRILIDHLTLLTDARSNSEFSELIQHYLSIYYDDIDILLLLAEFNRANSRYLEVIDVYLLAKTYAYSDFDQRRVDSQFTNFVNEIDNAYTQQNNWWDLINFYSHINATGLMTSSHQYHQALAHLRSGDQAFAIEQFNQLLNDSLVGDSAAQALSTLTNSTEAPPAINNPVPEGAEAIALKKQGNQFVASLSNNQQVVSLLIDTGASMTAVSSAAFNRLNTNGDAVAQDRRIFHTAGGVITGTVYSFPELTLGPYLMKNTRVAVIDFDNDPNIDGLLGMNILGQFRFEIDQQNARLLLSRQ